MKGLMRLMIFVLTAWPASPVYSQDGLKARCERWHPNILDGYCEYELAGQMP